VNLKSFQVFEVGKSTHWVCVFILWTCWNTRKNCWLIMNTVWLQKPQTWQYGLSLTLLS